MRLSAPHQPPPLQRQLPWKELLAGVGVTLGLHLAGLLVFLWGEASVDELDAGPVMALVVETELLRWGEVEPDDDVLPTIANPKPAPIQEASTSPEVALPPEETQEAPTEVVDLNAQDAATERDTQMRADERDQRKDLPTAQYRGETNPHRPTNDEAIQGYADGFKSGTSLSPSAQRNLLARIQEQLQRSFSPPRSISDDELRRLKIRIHVRIASDGRVLGWDVLEPSGNRQFDTAATMTLNRFRSGIDRLDMASISDTGFRELIEAQGLPIVMVGL